VTRLRIDANRCVGHGRCYELAPGLFTDDEFGHGAVEQENIDDADLSAARLAVDSCPEQAVLLEGR
jgi:ferredoxin